MFRRHSKKFAKRRRRTPISSAHENNSVGNSYKVFIIETKGMIGGRKGRKSRAGIGKRWDRKMNRKEEMGRERQKWRSKDDLECIILTRLLLRAGWKGRSEQAKLASGPINDPNKSNPDFKTQGGRGCCCSEGQISGALPRSFHVGTRTSIPDSSLN